MPRTALTPVTIANADPADLSALGTSLTLTFTAADVANKNVINGFNGTELILAKNTGASPYTVTVDGVKVKGRAGSIAAYSLAAGAEACIALPIDGWRQADGTLTLEASNASVLFCVIRHS